MTTPGRTAGDQELAKLRVEEPTRPERWTRRMLWFFSGRRPEPRPSRLGPLEAAEPGRVGICCSGGGIRSAAFNLGALQALQEKTILQKSTYLAAVSGGSYIAASFCMVAKSDDPDADDSDPRAFASGPAFHPGSPEEQYLRNRSSYLAPDGLSKLFLAYRVLLGLVFNLIFLGCALVAVGVALAAFVYRPLYGSLADPVARCAEGAGAACGFAADVPEGFKLALLVLGATILINGLALLLLRPRKDFWRRGFETWATRLMLTTAGLALVLVVLPVLAEVLLNYGDERGGQAAETASSPGLPAVGAGSFATVLLAVLLQLRARAAEPATVLQAVKGVRGFFLRLGPRSRVAFAYVAGAVAGPLLLLAIVLAAAAVTLAHSDASGTDGTVLAAGAASLAAFVLLYAVADLNTWSLHPFYRRRLCTAFALKRVRDEHGHPIAAERKYERLVPLSKTGVKGEWPTLIVCAAANVSDPGATPPGRGVTSFTFSETAIGGPLVGGERTSHYEKALGKNRRRDITLPAAVAMSGAALSPSMGKETRRPLTFLMALANVRLGVWIPNPRYMRRWEQRGGVRHGEDQHDMIKAPRPKYLFRELLGRNRLDAKFIYVSDGGHYENLGLVELLRRGCTQIYAFDASGGNTFTALGDAIALARSELGVEIDIDPSDLVPAGERNLAKSDCVRARFRYADGTPGVLIYARTVMTAAVPFDVTAYHEGDPKFPHHSTADQLYTDQKFEAYRALGMCAGNHAAEKMEQPPLIEEAEAAADGGPPRPGDADPDPALPRGRRPPLAAGALVDGRGDHRVLPRHARALEQARARRRLRAGDQLAQRHQLAGVEHAGLDRADHVAGLAQRRRARLDDHGRAGGERVVGLARVRLVRADRDHAGVVGDEAAVEQRLAGGRAAADDVGGGHELVAAAVLAAEHVDLLDRPDRPDRLGVGAGLRAAAEHHQPAGVGRREPPDRERRDRRRAQVGERDAVEQGDGRQRRAVEQHARALDARLARTDGHELDRRMAARGGRHHQQLALPHRQDRARRRRLRVELAQRPLERVDGVEQRQRGGVERPHRSTNPVPSASRGSSTNRCSPVRCAVPSTSVTSPSDVRSTTQAENVVPTIESCRSTCPGSRSSSATRADVPEPHGERSTSPSANTVTLRWCRSPTGSHRIVP
jgi:hypothetical protein